MKLFLLLLISPILTVGQTNYKGAIINKRTQEKIPFATVGLMKENIGTNAGEDGFFNLTSNNKKNNDTLIISCIGYEILKLPAEQLTLANNTNSFELTEQQTNLEEVIVTNKTVWATSSLNDFKNCGNSFITSSGYQTQLAQHFSTSAENSILTDVKICRMSNGILGPEKTIFRIRVYGIDTLTKSPKNDLCNEIIEVKSSSKFIKLDMEKYKIHIPDKDFFIAVEWLKIPYNENKTKIKLNGSEVENITYRPSIGWTDNESSNMEAWMLDYNNKWRPMFKANGKTSVSISATVKY